MSSEFFKNVFLSSNIKYQGYLRLNQVKHHMLTLSLAVKQVAYLSEIVEDAYPLHVVATLHILPLYLSSACKVRESEGHSFCRDFCRCNNDTTKYSLFSDKANEWLLVLAKLTPTL